MSSEDAPEIVVDASPEADGDSAVPAVKVEDAAEGSRPTTPTPPSPSASPNKCTEETYQQ